MLLVDIASVFGGIALAVVAFLVVILVCVIILRLLAAILPDYQGRDGLNASPEEPRLDEGTDGVDPEPDPEPSGEASPASGAAPESADDQPG